MKKNAHVMIAETGNFWFGFLKTIPLWRNPLFN